jgi:ribosome-binding protein aMBF1 (putative translation factor)
LKVKTRKENNMTREKMKELNLTPIEDLITEDFGAEGTPTRMEFDADVDAFILGERLKEERQKAGLTQEQLAEKIGTKKSYISRVENGHADIQVSTLLKIFQGLGRRVSLTIL